MPTISPFGLHGNHFGAKTHANIKSLSKHTNLISKYSSPNTKLLSPFDIKGNVLNWDE